MLTISGQSSAGDARIGCETVVTDVTNVFGRIASMPIVASIKGAAIANVRSRRVYLTISRPMPTPISVIAQISGNAIKTQIVPSRKKIIEQAVPTNGRRRLDRNRVARRTSPRPMTRAITSPIASGTVRKIDIPYVALSAPTPLVMALPIPIRIIPAIRPARFARAIRLPVMSL